MKRRTSTILGFLAVLSIVILQTNCNFIYFSLSKQLYIPGEKWSLLNVTHHLNALTPYVYDLNAEFILTQSTQYNQTNTVFDFLKSTGGQAQYSEFNTCYESSVNYMNSLYKQYQPCEEKCILPDSQKILRSTGLIESIGNDSTISQYLTFIIDNTFYPCSQGVYQPQLYLSEQINISIQSSSTFFTLLQIACVILLQILILLIAYIMIMFNKLHHQKSKLLKLKQQKDNKDVLKQFINSKKMQK